MPFRFQKRIRLAKGLSLNIGKKGISSVSVGRKGMRLSTGRRGTRVGASAAGTGLSASKRVGPGCLLPLGIVCFATSVIAIAI
jgi:hypothetical protein